LKIIEKSGYQALPWVRYITMAGEYELRLIWDLYLCLVFTKYLSRSTIVDGKGCLRWNEFLADRIKL